MSFISVPAEFHLFSQDKSLSQQMIGALSKKKKKNCATELQSHDATFPVVTSAPFFHLSPLLGRSCHIRRRIVAPSHPQVPLLPIPAVGRVAGPYKGACTESAEGSTVRGKTVWELRSLIFHFQGLPHRWR